MNNKSITTLFIISYILFLPSIIFSAGLIPCDGVVVKCDFYAFANFINTVINWFLGISVSVAAITFAYAGAQILFNPESPDKIKQAKDMFMKTAIGMLIILGAWLFIYVIVSTFVKTPGALRFLGR